MAKIMDLFPVMCKARQASYSVCQVFINLFIYLAVEA